jgi:hypothetical protein
MSQLTENIAPKSFQKKEKADSLKSLPFPIFRGMLILIRFFGSIGRVEERMYVTCHARPAGSRQRGLMPREFGAAKSPAVIYRTLLVRI